MLFNAGLFALYICFTSISTHKPQNDFPLPTISIRWKQAFFHVCFCWIFSVLHKKFFCFEILSSWTHSSSSCAEEHSECFLSARINVTWLIFHNNFLLLGHQSGIFIFLTFNAISVKCREITLPSVCHPRNITTETEKIFNSEFHFQKISFGARVEIARGKGLKSCVLKECCKRDGERKCCSGRKVWDDKYFQWFPGLKGNIWRNRSRY